MSGANTWQTFKRVTFRLLMPTAGSVLLILFVRTLESFETPALIGIPARIYVYTSEIFLAFNEYPPDYGRGRCVGGGLVVAQRDRRVALYSLDPREQKISDRHRKGFSAEAVRSRSMAMGRIVIPHGLFRFCCFVAFPGIAVGVIFALLCSSQLGCGSKAQLGIIIDTSIPFGRFGMRMKNSIILALLTASVAMMLTSLIAWIVYRSRLPGAWLLDFLAFVPITIPGIVMGMALILLYVAFPIPIYGTIWVLLIAYVTRFIPYGMRSASGSIVQIHSELEEAAAASGASWWETFRRVTLPLFRPGIVAGWIYICIVSFREFSTSVLLATGESRVLSILLFTMFEQGQVTIVAAIGILMILTLLTIVGIFYKVSGRVGIQT